MAAVFLAFSPYAGRHAPDDPGGADYFCISGQKNAPSSRKISGWDEVSGYLETALLQWRNHGVCGNQCGHDGILYGGSMIVYLTLSYAITIINSN